MKENSRGQSRVVTAVKETSFSSTDEIWNLAWSYLQSFNS